MEQETKQELRCKMSREKNFSIDEIIKTFECKKNYVSVKESQQIDNKENH